VKTVAVTGGSTEHPSPVGVFTITAKQNEMKISSTAAGMAGSQSSDSYDIPVHWVITLNGGPSLYAAPWASDSLGKRNETHGDIGMSPESAQWLYDHVKIGDLVQIQ
jgi:lipoprotein-anchoring transpeptidase ErfK/SrfK